jgi:hypothetical protein
VTQSGVQPIGTIAGGKFIFQRYYDVRTAVSAVGAYFPRDDYYVVASLNRIGNSGYKDGFIVARNGDGFTIHPFSTPFWIVSLLVTRTDSGDYQLLYGDSTGRVGVFLQANYFTDDIDFTKADPFANEEPVPWKVRTGLLAPGGGVKITGVRPSIKSVTDEYTFGDPSEQSILVEIDGHNRMANPNQFSSDVSRTITTSDDPPIYGVVPKSMQTALVQISGDSARTSRVEFSGIDLRVDVLDGR